MSLFVSLTKIKLTVVCYLGSKGRALMVFMDAERGIISKACSLSGRPADDGICICMHVCMFTTDILIFA
jgi:hypothetical protein